MDLAGAKSQLAGITSAIVVMFVLLFLTPVFKNMPQNVQGAVVISAVTGLFNYSEWFFLWRVSADTVTTSREKKDNLCLHDVSA